jgi:hypothetical protein
MWRRDERPSIVRPVDPELDAEKLQVLRDWSERLRRDERPELTAAGRAISVLVAEVERLRALLSDVPLEPEAGPEVTPEPELVDEPPGGELVPSLRERLGGRWRSTGRALDARLAGRTGGREEAPEDSVT